MKYKLYGFIRDFWYYLGKHFELIFLICILLVIGITSLLCGC